MADTRDRRSHSWANEGGRENEGHRSRQDDRQSGGHDESRSRGWHDEALHGPFLHPAWQSSWQPGRQSSWQDEGQSRRADGWQDGWQGGGQSSWQDEGGWQGERQSSWQATMYSITASSLLPHPRLMLLLLLLLLLLCAIGRTGTDVRR